MYILMNPKILDYLEEMRDFHEKKSYDDIVNSGSISEELLRIDDEKLHPAIWGLEFQDDALLVIQLTR